MSGNVLEKVGTPNELRKKLRGLRIGEARNVLVLVEGPEQLNAAILFAAPDGSHRNFGVTFRTNEIDIETVYAIVSQLTSLPQQRTKDAILYEVTAFGGDRHW